jgi:hypothetical protein
MISQDIPHVIPPKKGLFRHYPSQNRDSLVLLFLPSQFPRPETIKHGHRVASYPGSVIWGNRLRL